MLSSEVHPYDLLRYEHAVFSQDAIEALQETLKKYVSKRKQAAAEEGGRVMPTLYTVIRRPLITEKGMGVKETQNTLVFEVAEKATKTEVKQAVESALQGEGLSCPDRQSLKARSVAVASYAGYPPRLEEGVRSPEGRREDAGVPGQSVRAVGRPVSRQQKAARHVK